MNALLQALVTKRPPDRVLTLIVADEPIRLSSLGADEPAQGWGDWVTSKWSDLNSSLHRMLYGGSTALASGVVVPRELTDPAAVRAHLAEALDRYATVYGWPPEDVQRRVWAIQTAGNASTVYATVERCQGYGPDVAWPGAQSWYDLCDEIKRAIALVSAGEAAGTVRTTTVAAWQQAKDVAAAGLNRVDKVIEVQGKVAGGAGVGIGIGLVIVAVGAAIIFLGPELFAVGVVAKGAR